MRANKMLQLCKQALSYLDDLESLLPHLSSEKDAARFVYEAIADVKELKHVAKFETVQNVTVEQATHMNRIMAQIEYYTRIVPDSVKREFNDDK